MSNTALQTLVGQMGDAEYFVQLYAAMVLLEINKKAAKVFANIAGKKTLDQADLANIKALGFLVVEIPVFPGVPA